MTDPALTPDPAAAKARLNKVFLFAAATDIVTGLVLAAVGLSAELEAMVVVGAVLALSGTAVLAWVILRTNRPEEL